MLPSFANLIPPCASMLLNKQTCAHCLYAYLNAQHCSTVPIRLFLCYPLLLPVALQPWVRFSFCLAP